MLQYLKRIMRSRIPHRRKKKEKEIKDAFLSINRGIINLRRDFRKVTTENIETCLISKKDMWAWTPKGRIYRMRSSKDRTCQGIITSVQAIRWKQQQRKENQHRKKYYKERENFKKLMDWKVFGGLVKQRDHKQLQKNFLKNLKWERNSIRAMG